MFCFIDILPFCDLEIEVPKNKYFQSEMTMINDKTYLRPYQATMMELFRENSCRILAGNYFAREFHIDVSHVPKYATGELM